MKVAFDVPALPSVTVTSLIDERRRGVVVGDRAEALRVGDRGVRPRWLRLTMKLSSTSSRRSPLTGTVTVLAGLAGREGRACRWPPGSRPARSRVPSAGRVVDASPAGRWRRRGVTVNVDVARAGVALGDRHVVDRERGQRVVVGDRAEPAASAIVALPRRAGRA